MNQDTRNQCPDCKAPMKLIQSIVGFPTIFHCPKCGLLHECDCKGRETIHRTEKKETNP